MEFITKNFGRELDPLFQPIATGAIEAVCIVGAFSPMDEGEELIPTGATGNYLLCDEKGTMAVAEISNGDFRLEMKPQIIRTNVFLLQHEIESTNKSPEQYEYAYGGHVSFARLERGQDLLTEAQTLQEILGVLSETQSG